MYFLILTSLLTPAVSFSAAKLSEFCSVAVPAIKAPFECASERKSATVVESVVTAYRSTCPGLQERFESLDQRRHKLVNRCVLFNPSKGGEPKGCEADRAAASSDLKGYRAQVNQLLSQVTQVAEAIGAEPPREISCRVYHDQHRFVLTTLRERLQNLLSAADRAEAEARESAPVKADRERVKPADEE